MSFQPPVPQGEHLNKRNILLIAAGLLVVLLGGYWLVYPSGQSPSPASDHLVQPGQATFLSAGPDSSGAGGFPRLAEVPADTGFVPPPPDEVFRSTPEKIVQSPRPTPARPQELTEQEKLYQEALQSEGTVYEASQEHHRYPNKQIAGGYGSSGSYSNPKNRRTTVSAEVIEPGTPYVLMEGYMIPAVLETAIDSDLPGHIRAIITRDIYDAIQMKHLLIPKGTELIGSYDERVVLNQRKLLMSWFRMIFPDGRSVHLPDLNSYDLRGRSGLSGKVDTHFWKKFGQSAFMSLIGAGVNVASPGQRGFYSEPDLARQTAEQMAQEFNRVSGQVLRRNLSMAPTISIPGGTPLHVFLAGDIAFQEPYEYSPPSK